MPDLTMSLPSLHAWPSVLEQSLSGEQGTNREASAKCQIQARNDYEALQCWLREYQQKQTTFRTYQKEGERFLLWCVYERRKALSSLNRDDVEAYLHFLDNPVPRDKWCGAKTGVDVGAGMQVGGRLPDH